MAVPAPISLNPAVTPGHLHQYKGVSLAVQREGQEQWEGCQQGPTLVVTKHNSSRHHEYHCRLPRSQVYLYPVPLGTAHQMTSPSSATTLLISRSLGSSGELQQGASATGCTSHSTHCCRVGLVSEVGREVGSEVGTSASTDTAYITAGLHILCMYNVIR